MLLYACACVCAHACGVLCITTYKCSCGARMCAQQTHTHARAAWCSWADESCRLEAVCEQVVDDGVLGPGSGEEYVSVVADGDGYAGVVGGELGPEMLGEFLYERTC